MACFIAPMTEAVVTTIVTKVAEKKGTEKSMEVACKLDSLNKMLWGGSALLAFEHVWHGEVQPFMPFLTAAATAEGTAEMLHELLTSGVAMAVLVTAIWGAIMVVQAALSKKKEVAVSES